MFSNITRRLLLAIGLMALASAPLTAKAQTASASSTGALYINGSWQYMLGVNYAWWNYGTDFGTGKWGKFTKWDHIDNAFGYMSNRGVRVVRWFFFADGRYAPDFNSDGTVSKLDASVLADVDRALVIANKYNMYLMPVVIDGLIWGAPINYSGVQLRGRSQMVTNAAAQQSFLDKALKPLLEHVAASPYRSRVVAYDIVNEPEANMAGYWGGSRLSLTAVRTFIKRCADYIHLYGGTMATVGSAGTSWVRSYTGLGLDFYQVHYYPVVDKKGPGSGLPMASALGLDKPVVVGEFPTKCSSYALTDTAPLSAKWYLDTIRARGYAGALGWSFGGTDVASDWNPFKPVFADWVTNNVAFAGPR